MIIYVAIDDTDNLDTKGTGFKSRQLAEVIDRSGLAVTMGITRHQLLVHEEIPFTSHNSSACLKLDGGNPGKIAYICKTFLLSESAPGSDAGLCIAPDHMVNEEIMEWGRRAKQEVLKKEDAAALAKRSLVYLEGFTGTHGGIIGALAAVGLRKAGNDGRYLWTKGMQRYMGVVSARELLDNTGVEKIVTDRGATVETHARIMLHDWWRPLLIENQAVLIVKENNAQTNLYEYKVISKNHIRRISA